MTSIALSNVRDDVRLLTIDMPGKSANVLTDQVYADLDEALNQLESDPPAGLILVSAKPSIYVAGADLVKISGALHWNDRQIIEFCENGRAIMRRISLLPTVSVAAIHGVCVGGGLEFTLWCDHRILSDNPRTLLGLPEVKLGLIPGWAGTVRLPRLIGLAPATELATSGRLIDAPRSRSLGIATDVVSQDLLINRATEIIEGELATKQYLDQRDKLVGPVTELPADLGSFQREMEAQIEANSEVHPQAPRIVLEHMIRTAGWSAAEACDSESVAMTQVWGSPENAGLLHYFFLEERAKKTRPSFAEGEQPEIQTVGIVGTGLIGSQIVRLSLEAGYSCVIYDADQVKQQKLVDELCSSGQWDPSNLRPARGLEEFEACQLVIESVVENLTVKRDLFGKLESIVDDRAFLVTNPSTIPVGEIGQSISDPQRLVGLHFCFPVEPLRLVEVIRADQTSELTVNVGLDFVRRIRKTPVVMRDRAGFVVNRLLCPVINQANVWLLHGLSPAEIDAPFREFGFAVGPLEMIDFIGVDTIFYAAKTLLRYYPQNISLTPILPALVKGGRLGRKSGSGFYRYETADGAAVEDPRLYEILRSYQKESLTALTGDEILDSLLNPMIDEAERLLVEDVVADSRDIDLCSILGTTFPAHRGGLMFWSQQRAALPPL